MSDTQLRWLSAVLLRLALFAALLLLAYHDVGFATDVEFILAGVSLGSALERMREWPR